jgi:hypothetical protein
MRGGRTRGERKKMQKEREGRFKRCKKEGVRIGRGKIYKKWEGRDIS